MAMPPLSYRRRTTPAPQWLPLCLAAMIMLGLLTVSPPAFAHDVEGSSAAVPASLSQSELLTLHPDGPHCHHGQPWGPLPGALIRGEAQEAELEAYSPSSQEAATAPRDEVTPGIPQGPVAASPVPLYLLTQRFRS